MKYDDKCFVRAGSAWRREMMSRWTKIPGGRTVIAVDHQGHVVGYGCRNPDVEKAGIHFVGPVYADSCNIARDLVYVLTRDVVGQTVVIRTV